MCPCVYIWIVVCACVYLFLSLFFFFFTWCTPLLFLSSLSFCFSVLVCNVPPRYYVSLCEGRMHVTDTLHWMLTLTSGSCVTSHLPQSFATRHFARAQKQKQEEKSCRRRSCKSEPNTQNPAKAECRAIPSVSRPLETGRVDSNVCPALLPASVPGLLTSIAIFWDFLYIDRWGLELEAREIHVFVWERERLLWEREKECFLTCKGCVYVLICPPFPPSYFPLSLLLSFFLSSRNSITT